METQNWRPVLYVENSLGNGYCMIDQASDGSWWFEHVLSDREAVCRRLLGESFVERLAEAQKLKSEIDAKFAAQLDRA